LLIDIKNKILRNIYKIVLFLLFLIVSFLYNSDTFMFKVLPAMNDITKNKLHIVETRNILMNFVDNLNPLNGNKVLFDKEYIDVINIGLSQKDINKFQKVIYDATESKKFNINNNPDNTLYENLYIKSKIFINGDEYKGKIRFHSIHFFENKRSFAFKLSKNKLYNNMRKFSLLVPEEIGVPGAFSFEVIRKYYDMDVKYKLINLRINNISQGIYFLEEKVGKTLLERNGLSGVDIMKANDTWNHQYRNGGHVHPFIFDNANMVLKSITKKDLGQKYIFDMLNMEDSYNSYKKYIDLEKFAKAEAIRFLFNDDHGIAGDNLKLLYSTSSGRFFPYVRTENVFKKLNNANYNNNNYEPSLYGTSSKDNNRIYLKLIQSNEFRALRNKYLYQFILDRKFLINTYSSLYNKIVPLYSTDISNNLPTRYYKFVENEMLSYLAHNLNAIEKYINYSKAFVTLKQIDQNKHILTIKADSNVPLAIETLKVITKSSSIQIKNLQNNKIQTLKVSELEKFFKEDMFSLSLDNTLKVKMTEHKYEFISQDLDVSSFKISFKNTITNIKVEDRLVSTTLIKKPKKLFLKSTNIINFFKENSHIIAEVNNKEVILKSGVFSLKNDFILPYGYSLSIQKNTTIQLAKDISVVVYGGLSILGTKDAPVVIKNLVKNEPFGVVAAIGDGNTLVNINYLDLSGGNEDFVNGAHFSGAISLYLHNSVLIKHTKIHHNSADDGLNIKNSKVLLKNNIFYSNLADQVDLDFCIGKIEDNEFYQKNIDKVYNSVIIPPDNNGDGLDFSGSRVIIKNNIFNGFLDKGISIGENTLALINSNTFSNNRSAMTVKDQSQVYVLSNSYNDNDISIEMYQKKKIFKHPYLYNINEKHDIKKLKKTQESHFYKLDDDFTIENSINDINIFEILSKKKWLEYE